MSALKPRVHISRGVKNKQNLRPNTKQTYFLSACFSEYAQGTVWGSPQKTHFLVWVNLRRFRIAPLQQRRAERWHTAAGLHSHPSPSFPWLHWNCTVKSCTAFHPALPHSSPSRAHLDLIPPWMIYRQEIPLDVGTLLFPFFPLLINSFIQTSPSISFLVFF